MYNKTGVTMICEFTLPNREKHETLRRKNSFTRLNMHDDSSSKFLMPLPSARFQSPSKPLPTHEDKGKITEDDSKKGGSKLLQQGGKIGRSRSEPILRPTRSLSSLSEITSDVDPLSSHSSDVESMDEELDELEINSSIHSNTAHDDSAELSPKVKPRERSATVDKGTLRKPTVISGGVAAKESPVPTTEKATTTMRPGKKWALSLFPRRDDDKDSKHRKHASMILPRTESGSLQGDFMHVSNKHRSASFEADSAPAHLKGSPGVHPVSVDYSAKKANNRFVLSFAFVGRGAVIAVGLEPTNEYHT